MQKAEAQHKHTQSQPTVRQSKGASLESAQSEQIAQLEAMIDSSPQAARLAQFSAMVNNSPQVLAQRRMMDSIRNSPRMAAQRKVADAIHNSPHIAAQRRQLDGIAGKTAQREEMEEPLQPKVAQREEAEELMQPKAIQRKEEEELIQGKFEAASSAQLKEEAVKPNNTGLPDNLKSGIESLSGISMDNVRVHYNSSQPAQLNALAYAQGTDIHVAPGQEQHLPHEAWHVVQQAQGRVQPTMQMKESVPVNDDKSLEHEADVMGVKAADYSVATGSPSYPASGMVGYPVRQNKQVIQLFDWLHSTPFQTILDWFRSPSVEGAKDVVDPRRARLNPLNVIEGFRNYSEETAGGNYHSSSRHGAHNTVTNAMGRLAAPSSMQDRYGGGIVAHAGTQGRFNSEAWESFSWRKAKELFANDIGVPVAWVPGPLGPPRSTWTVCLNHVGSDVGISQASSQAGVAGAINSVSGVRVAINYTLAGAGGGVAAYNGQMFPTAPLAPQAGHVIPGDPAGAGMNGTVQPIPYKFLGYFGI